MIPEHRPPGPSWQSERGKSFKQRLEELRNGPIPYIRRRFEQYGDLYFTTNLGTPMYVTQHPDHFHEILVTRAQSFAKRSRDVDVFLGQGLFTSHGETWRRQRRLIQPAFQHHKIAAYVPVMVDKAKEMLARWQHGDTRDINREMMELTLGVVCKAVLDHEQTGGDNDAIALAMTILQDTGGKWDPLPRWFPSPVHLAQKKAVRELDRIIFNLIDSRARGGRREDLVSQLMFASDEQGTMSRQQLRDELVTLYLAGHETTALAMTWTFFLLALYPDEEAKLHEEVDRVLGRRDPTFEDYDKLERTRWIITEAMRMFPPLYIFPRIAVEDTQVAGYPVPKGSELVLWIYFAQRDPRWFTEPAEFRPGRWAPDSGAVRHPHAYLPFGLGQRTCVGRNFAMVEATLLLAAISSRFSLRPISERVQLFPRVTLGPKEPIRMRLEARVPSPDPSRGGREARGPLDAPSVAPAAPRDGGLGDDGT